VAIWRGRGAARVIPRTSCRWSSRGARPGGAGDGTTSRNGRKRTDHHTFCADKVLEIQPMVIQQPSLPLQDRWQGPTAAETVSPAPRHTKYSMSSNHGNLSQNTWQAGDHYHRSLWIHGEIARKCSVSASRPDTRNRRPPRWEDGGWNDKAGGRPSPPLAGVRVGLIWAHALCARGPHPPLAHRRPTQSPTGNSPSGTAAAEPHPHSKARKRTQSPAGTSLPRTAAAGPHPLAKARQRTQSPAGSGPPVTIRHQPITATQSVGLGPGTKRHDHGPKRGVRNRIPADDWSTGPG